MLHIGLLLPWALCTTNAQLAFRNLDFESANIAEYPVGTDNVPITAGLPGWSVGLDGSNKTATIWYDATSLGGALISVNDINTGFGFMPIDGNFSAYLFSSGFSVPDVTSISQTGLVPSGTRFLQAKMSVHGPAPVVMLGGQVINMLPLETLPTYTLYGGEISAFAERFTTLSFTEPAPFHNYSSLLLDGIVFSQQIPEPTSLTLFGVGALILGFFRPRNALR